MLISFGMRLQLESCKPCQGASLGHMSDSVSLPPIDVPDTEKRMFDLSANQGPLAALNGEVPPAPKWFSDTVVQAPESAFVPVDGAQIHYLRWGDRAKPGLLLVHGNAAHAYWWSFIAPYLARDYNVAAMDLSGMGDSDWRKTYSMHQFAHEQLAVCEAAGMFAVSEPPVIAARLEEAAIVPGDEPIVVGERRGEPGRVGHDVDIVLGKDELDRV